MTFPWQKSETLTRSVFFPPQHDDKPLRFSPLSDLTQLSNMEPGMALVRVCVAWQPALPCLHVVKREHQPPPPNMLSGRHGNCWALAALWLVHLLATTLSRRHHSYTVTSQPSQLEVKTGVISQELVEAFQLRHKSSHSHNWCQHAGPLKICK